MLPSTTLPIYDVLLKKIYTYYETIWQDKWREEIDTSWLSNFVHADENELHKEKVNMLYLLSKFMYFGNNELRQLLLSLYRDLYKYPIISSIRKANGNTIDVDFIDKNFENEVQSTRFLGVGNPSESGVHLLYYFRQECGLSKENFINSSDIFSTFKVDDVDPFTGNPRTYLKSQIFDGNINRYIFIDDFCGSGDQAKQYLSPIAENIKFENPAIEIKYLMLFGTESGINELRKIKFFDAVDAVFTIDESFKAFSDSSRYFKEEVDILIDKKYSEATATKYGGKLFQPALGHGNCQLLFGLFHNTPDNSLPIFWSNRNDWKPIFKRFNKIY